MVYESKRKGETQSIAGTCGQSLRTQDGIFTTITTASLLTRYVRVEKQQTQQRRHEALSRYPFLQGFFLFQNIF